MSALCRESAAAAQATPGAAVRLDLDPSLGAVTTDAERLRVALVNLIVNARHAVEAQGRDAVAAAAALEEVHAAWPAIRRALRATGAQAIAVSAHAGTGLRELRAERGRSAISDRARHPRRPHATRHRHRPAP